MAFVFFAAIRITWLFSGTASSTTDKMLSEGLKVAVVLGRKRSPYRALTFSLAQISKRSRSSL